jgi:2-oxoisovalerate dehydrogenase E2 component (dihydrolipoyl transacylase)
MAKVKMPQLGESVAEGTIGRWLKKPGDHVDKYEPIVEVITDKVNAEVPSPFAGTLTAILVEEGATVPNNAEIAEIDEGGAAAASPEPTAAPAATGGPAEPQDEPERTVLGTSAPAPEAPSGDGRTMPGAPAAPPTPAAPPPQPAAQPQPPAAMATAAPPTTAEEPGEPSGRVTPAVRRLAREHGVDLSRVQGTGHGGRITREDVTAFAAQMQAGTAPAAAAPAATPAPAAPAQASAPAAAPPAAAAAPAAAAPRPAPMAEGVDEELIPPVPMRRMIAEHMVKAKTTAPHAYTCIEVDMSGVVRAREAAKANYQSREGIGLSFVPFVIKGVTEALSRHPNMNALWTDQGLLRKRHVNIGVAVAVDDGLIVPVIHDADRLSINGLNHAVVDLAARARSQQLKLDEVQGGTITVNNTGWFGSVTSQPIINIPQIVIISMEAIVKRPVVIETPEGDTIGIRPIMALCASFDHRATDGAQIGRFMQEIRKELESVSADTPIW